MKKLIIIVAVLLVLGVAAGLYIHQQVRGMAQGAKIIIIMQRLGQFSADLKKQGSFTNDIPQLCDIYPYTNSVIVNGSQQQCTLAAKSPLFGDGGVMAITTQDTVLWIDAAGKATPFNGQDSATP
jgi:hypothetical protein